MIKRIYQITERDPEHDYRFMGLDYVQKKGITVTRADYDLIYTAPLTEKDAAFRGWKGNIEIPAKCGITAANLLCI